MSSLPNRQKNLAVITLLNIVLSNLNLLKKFLFNDKMSSESAQTLESLAVMLSLSSLLSATEKRVLAAKMAKTGDIVRFTFQEENYEVIIKSKSNDIMYITPPTKLYTGPTMFSWYNTNWHIGLNNNVVELQIMKPWSEEATGKKFHSDGATEFTTHRLTDLYILTLVDDDSFQNLRQTNKLLHSISTDKFHSKELFQERVALHYPQYLEQVRQATKKEQSAFGKMSWREIYVALRYINLDVENIAEHYVSNLDWVNDRTLPLLKLYDILQCVNNDDEEGICFTRQYLKCRINNNDSKTWNYFVERYPITSCDLMINVDNIRSFLYDSQMPLFEKFYIKNWEILQTDERYHLVRILYRKLTDQNRDEKIAIDDTTFSKTLLERMTAKERSILVYNVITYHMYHYDDKLSQCTALLNKFYNDGFWLISRYAERLRINFPNLPIGK